MTTWNEIDLSVSMEHIPLELNQYEEAIAFLKEIYDHQEESWECSMLKRIAATLRDLTKPI